MADSIATSGLLELPKVRKLKSPKVNEKSVVRKNQMSGQAKVT